jgi:hypothetical protein
LLAALLTITLVTLRTALAFKEDTSFVSVVLAKFKVAFAATATLKPFKKSLHINTALRQL